MTDFKLGEVVGIPCEINSGPFSEEKFITVRSENEVFTGFVSEKLLYNIIGDNGYVYGIVQDIKEGMVNVWIDGSFFNTAGLTKFNIDWANTNIKST